jgi:NAD(P)-dependent dehydrogenase (short-subunit alcohol dehydrogenase family)
MTFAGASNDDLKVNRLFDVSNFKAVVTGGGTGIGLMITQALVSNGAKVYITGRREDALKTVAEKHSSGGKIIPYSRCPHSSLPH